MNSGTLRVQNLQSATIDEKLALIDELWESVRRSGEIAPHPDHLTELERRAAKVESDSNLALSPDAARALFRL